MRRLALILAGLVLMMALGTTGVCLAASSSAPGPCPAGQTCISGKLLVRDPGSDTPHQLLVLDKNGAPMFWVDYGGAWSGGAPVCVTDLALQPVACLGGPHGSYGGVAVVTLYAHGRGYSLSARDITWLHAHGG